MTDDRLDLRLPSIKVVDVILASLQAFFGQDKFFGNTSNPYRFVRDDPSQSKVWICDKDEREGERDGKRMLIQVMRGDYNPSELHLQNRATGGFSNPISQSDLASAPVYITCEAGTQLQSEILASMCYSVLKCFREDLMADYDIHSLRVLGVSPASKQKGVNGEPWLTTVTLKIEMQEICTVIEIANNLNRTLIRGALDRIKDRAIVSLDSPAL